MVRVPYNTPSAAIMALTFQKFHCNQFLKNFNINVPEAVLIKPGDTINEKQIIENDLHPAIKEVINHGTEVIVEENIESRELACGVYRDIEETKGLPVTEITSENEYFDYDAKYNGKSNEIAAPDLVKEMTTKIQSLTKEIYGILGMKGIARIDYIVSKDNVPYLIEINSVPGMSKESIVPQMVNSAKLSLNDIIC